MWVSHSLSARPRSSLGFVACSASKPTTRAATMSEMNAGLISDPLFVGATRPPMRWGVTYAALLFNLVFSLEIFLISKNLLSLLLAAPIHGICALLCARDPRFFDLVV